MTTPSDSRFQLAVASPVDVPLDELPGLHHIEWLICKRDGEQCLQFCNRHVTVASLDFDRARFDLPNLLAVFVIGTESECQALKDRWDACFPSVAVDFHCLPEFDANSLARAAVDCLAGHLTRQRMLSGRAALDLAVYRREFERLQRSFGSLEHYVGEYSLQKLRMLFEYPSGTATFIHGAQESAEAGTPDGNWSRGSGDVPSGDSLRVEQHLPLDSLGVAGIAIDVRAKTDSDASIRVELRAMETGQRFGAWSIPTSKLPIGWLHLSLSHAIDRSGLSLVVTIGFPSERGAYALGLGSPHPYEKFRARIIDGAPLEGPLAMRIYGGLPGVRVPVTTTAIAPTGASLPSVTYVNADLYKSVRQVFPAPNSGGSNFVLYDTSLASITVHPREGGAMTVARFDLAVPANAWRISAEIALEHESANPTEFALLSAPVAEFGHDADLLAEVDEQSARFSGWIRLAALERKRISAFFPKGSDRHLSVYLLTRQAPGSSADFAWARFAQFEFNAAPRELAPSQEQPPANATVPANGLFPDASASSADIGEMHEAEMPSDVQPS